MRVWWALGLGVVIGQWLAFAGLPSPADLHRMATRAEERRDFAEAARFWSQAADIQPANATYHYLRATALEHLGLRHTASEAYRLALALEPPPRIAALARDRVGALMVLQAGGQISEVVLEAAHGVWVVDVTLNDTRKGRFLLDTGSSVTLVAPPLATALGLRAAPDAESIQLETVNGRTAGPVVTLASLRVGGVEARDLPVVLHDPGYGVDGILGNSFLARYHVTLDADRRLLRLRPPHAG